MGIETEPKAFGLHESPYAWVIAIGDIDMFNNMLEMWPLKLDAVLDVNKILFNAIPPVKSQTQADKCLQRAIYYTKDHENGNIVMIKNIFEKLGSMIDVNNSTDYKIRIRESVGIFNRKWSRMVCTTY
jgi:hypothetical protein